MITNVVLNVLNCKPIFCLKADIDGCHLILKSYVS